MPVDFKVPQWLKDQSLRWINRLCMTEWTVVLALDLAPSGDPDVRGLAEAQPVINRGLITLRADIEPTQDWEITLVHELLHVKHSRVDAFISDILAEHSGYSNMVNQVYAQFMEPFIQSMAEVLVDAYRDEPQAVVEAEETLLVAGANLEAGDTIYIGDGNKVYPMTNRHPE